MMTATIPPMNMKDTSTNPIPTTSPTSPTAKLSTTRRIQSWQRKPGLTASNNERVFVKHNYRDHMHDKASDIELGWLRIHRNMPLEKQPFLLKLHTALSVMERDGLTDVFTWLPHGRAFKVLHKARFETDVLPKYFLMRNYTSFMRQCNIYNFRRLTRGSGKESSGAHYHDCFLKGRPWLCHAIKRTKVKGVGIKPAAQFEKEPKFFQMPVCHDPDPKEKQEEEEQDNIHINVDATSVKSAAVVVSPPSSPFPATKSSQVFVQKKAADVVTLSNDSTATSTATAMNQPAKFEGQQFFPLLTFASSSSLTSAMDHADDDAALFLEISCNVSSNDDDLLIPLPNEDDDESSSVLNCFGNNFFCASTFSLDGDGDATDDDLSFVNEFMNCCSGTQYENDDNDKEDDVESFTRMLMAEQ